MIEPSQPLTDRRWDQHLACVNDLINAARQLDDPFGDYQTFKRVMWLDDRDMRRRDMNRVEYEAALLQAWSQFNRSS